MTGNPRLNELEPCTRVPVLLRPKQVAEMLGISRSLVYQLVEQGKLGCYRIGLGRGAIRFRLDDVEAYLAGCRVETTLPTNRHRATRGQLKHVKLAAAARRATASN